MKPVFAYIRVSTVKQGERGSSLQEQKSAIEAYARRNDLRILEWFEEMETAAKSGRSMFARLLSGLAGGKARGVIIHKIDRGARNLRDWADLVALSDAGIEVHFAHESLDLLSRGGRLSADIQAVVAADYVRNLREEVRKGFYGRLKQGFYPLPAPIGYLDQGKARPKIFDPERAPLVRQAFELYATGGFSLDTLRQRLFEMGLRNRAGQMLSTSSMAQILHNPFYVGLIRIGKTGETFEGLHKPLVPVTLFERVQNVLSGKHIVKTQCHDHMFRQTIRCAQCGRHLTGEVQKGMTYYRCHGCPGTSVREDRFDAAMRDALFMIRFDERDMRELREILREQGQKSVAEGKDLQETAKLALGRVEERLMRLTDAYLDGSIERDLLDARKASLLVERRSLLDRVSGGHPRKSVEERTVEMFELASTAYLRYETGIPFEKREIAKLLSSNLLVDGKKPVITLRSPYQEVRNLRCFQSGGPRRGTIRTYLRKCAEIFSNVAEAHTHDAPWETFRTSAPNDDGEVPHAA